PRPSQEPSALCAYGCRGQLSTLSRDEGLRCCGGGRKRRRRRDSKRSCGIAQAHRVSYMNWFRHEGDPRMPFDTRKILLERFLARRTRQRTASVARAKESSQGARQAAGTTHVDLSVQVVVPAALRKYNDAAVRRLIASGKRRGFVTFEEANDILPAS